jgi:hypothetical protein
VSEDSAFIVAIEESAGEYMIVLWNPTGAEPESLSLDLTASAGKVDSVARNSLGDNFVPGHPTYFWVLPSTRRFAAVYPNGGLIGHENLQTVFAKFLEVFNPRHCFQRKLSENEYETVYKESSESEPSAVLARFSSRPSRTPHHVEEIISSRSQIRRIVVKQRVERERAETKALYSTLLRWVTNSDTLMFPDEKLMERKFRFHLDFTPNEDELEQLLEEVAEMENNYYNSIGVVFAGETQKVAWLHSSLQTFQPDLSITKMANGMYDPSALLDKLKSCEVPDWK